MYVLEHISVRSQLKIAGLLLLASAGAAPAADLNGVWANQPDGCATIFVKKGTRVEFSPSADIYGSGFIIEGSVIRGKTATCKILTMSQNGNVAIISAACASDVMVSETKFQLKTNEPGTPVRMVPGLPELDTKYFRCPTQ